MRDGFVKTAAVTPDMRVADVAYNTEKICEAIVKQRHRERRLLYFRSCVSPDTRAGICLRRKFFSKRRRKP